MTFQCKCMHVCLCVCELPPPEHTQKMSSVDDVVASFACNAAKVSDRYKHTHTHMDKLPLLLLLLA